MDGLVGVDGTLLSAVTELREDGRGGREGPVRDTYYQNIHIDVHTYVRVQWHGGQNVTYH